MYPITTSLIRFSNVGLWLFVYIVGQCLADDLSHAHPTLVSEHPCPDPHVFFDGSDWYIFGTGSKPFFLQGKHFGVGQMNKVFLDLDYSSYHGKAPQIWGFIVHKDANSNYHAYATLHLGNLHTVIAYFQPNDQHWEKGKPITRWKFKNLLVGDPARQDWNYYESKIIEDKNARWLMFCSRVGRDNWIVARKLKTWGTLDNSVQQRLILKPEGFRSEDRNGPGSMQLVEGGSIFRWKDTYVLLYSVGDYLTPNYKLGMAFSDVMIPPPGKMYVKVKMSDPNHVWGASNHRDEVTYLLQSEKANWPNYSARFAVGPGLGSVVMMDDQPWLFFHAYKPDDPKRNPANRFVYRVPISINISQHEHPKFSWLTIQQTDPRMRGAGHRQARESLRDSFDQLLVTDARWEGVSDWGGGKTTKSELRLIRKTDAKTDWEFSFLEPSIFKTPVPFHERWSGEVVNNDNAGIVFRLTRHDGKAVHEYDLLPNGRLDGKAVGVNFRYKFSPKH